jgi:hypothetical protein
MIFAVIIVSLDQPTTLADLLQQSVILQRSALVLQEIAQQINIRMI